MSGKTLASALHDTGGVSFPQFETLDVDTRTEIACDAGVAMLPALDDEFETFLAELGERSIRQQVAEVIERRGTPRLSGDAVADIALSFPGRGEATIHNVSAGGALVETSQRLCPGRAVDIAVRCGTQRVTVRATIVRAAVFAITPEPTYWVALQFEQAVLLPERRS